MRSFKALLFAAVVAGCAGSGAVRYSATAEVSTPEMVEVEPGVMVVADYNEPVFYSEGVYWRYESGTWYRSPYYNRSWVRISTPPLAVRRIERPEIYVHYRAGARDRREARAYQPQQNPEVRDHRTYPQPAPAPMPAPAPAPDVRDHRTYTPAPTPLPPSPPDVRDHRDDHREDHRDDRRDDHRDDRQDRREEKRDDRQDRREEKLERKEEHREDKAERREDKQERREDKAERREDKHEHRDDKHDDHNKHGHH
ncbi:MAG TPA: hypothetical protein VMZ53_04150 [Kofleriaceae bacterium]|nr:hypothetical protein [Kofleriaceae bacterium]